MIHAINARTDLAERMLNAVLTISIANPLADLLTNVMEDDAKWWEEIATEVVNAAAADRANILRNCFANTLREAQRRAASPTK